MRAKEVVTANADKQRHSHRCQEGACPESSDPAAHTHATQATHVHAPSTHDGGMLCKGAGTAPQN